MSSVCTNLPRSSGQTSAEQSAVEAPAEILLEIAQRYGTPAYAYDLERIRAQIAKLRAHLPAGVEVLYSLKANASLGLCGLLAGYGFGADLASAGELVTARAAGFPSSRIFVTGPDRSPALLDQLRSAPEAVLSVESLSELETLGDGDRGQRRPARRLLLRLRPDFSSYATCAAGPDSRFGLLFEELPRCRELLVASEQPSPRIVGFHVFAGSQVLDPDAIRHHLHSGVDLALRAANVLGLTPEIIDLGGGFGVPYGPGDQELDLAPVAEELAVLRDRVAPARLVLELGRYFVAQAGWYLTTVLARQTHRGRRAVVVDGGSHQRSDLCGIGLRTRGFPPVLLRERTPSPNPLPPGGEDRARGLAPTDVLGCLSLPADVLAENALLPTLQPGDMLAFPNAGAYGYAASPLLFHCHPPPAEVAFEGQRADLLRSRPGIASVLENQLMTAH